MQTASPTVPSNVLTFPAGSFPALPGRRFGRARQSSVHRLGVWLFNRATSQFTTRNHQRQGDAQTSAVPAN